MEGFLDTTRSPVDIHLAMKLACAMEAAAYTYVSVVVEPWAV